MRFSTILTSEQAAILYDLVKANRPAMVAARSVGFWDGLLQSLSQIDRGGGAVLGGHSTVFDYYRAESETGSLSGGPGGPPRAPRIETVLRCGDLIEAVIIPASTYIVLPGIKAPTGPFWDLAAILPELRVDHFGQSMVWRPVSIYCAKNPLAIVPLMAAVLPPLPLR